MDEPRIKDIPSFKKLLEDTHNMRQFKRLFPVMRPFLRLFKIDATAIEESLLKVEDLSRRVQELASVPDRFNDLFAQRGWIMYPEMGLEIATAAINRADGGDIDNAEVILVEYYTPERIGINLRWMNAVKAFHPRMRLARKALDDYASERYHACVPVVLALLDGLVSELHEQRRGFFADDVNLTAWDSIAAHNRGLNALVAIFQKGRRKTNVDAIAVPYRHGIMHGMDLGYDNRLVAAKTWAALFATRDWAVRAERGQLSATPPEKPVSWRELVARLLENEDDKQRIGSWQPRDIHPGREVPCHGDPGEYPMETPERRLAEFLVLWTRKNYGHMAECIAPFDGSPAKAAARIRERYASRALRSFAFESISDEAPAITEIVVTLVYATEGEVLSKSHTFRLVHADPKGNPSVRGKTGHCWFILNWESL